MSLARYLSLIGIANCVAAWVVSYVLADGHFVSGWEMRLLWVGPFAGLAAVGAALRFVPEPEERTNFWAYRASNFTVAAAWAVLLVLAVLVQFGR